MAADAHFSRLLRLIAALGAAAALRGGAVVVHADAAAIDVAQSQLTIAVSKSGFFSAFADNHVIRAPIAQGSLSAAAPPSVAITVHARDLQVLDPSLAADKRQEVQTRMLGPEVLDVDTYPQITFSSKTVESTGADRWRIEGDLSLHGKTKPVSFDAALTKGAYRGSVRVRQRDFGITPISIAGGTVKVKDEVVIEFVIVPREQ
ncbi:MAG TPA: YceI family protein [Vicinamibacterales bacterium]|nr:YceI family protein [Vicinamibacterales bacterium]